MSKGPKREKRPGDVTAHAGARARTESLTKARRREIAKKVAARWRSK